MNADFAEKTRIAEENFANRISAKQKEFDDAQTAHNEYVTKLNLSLIHISSICGFSGALGTKVGLSTVSSTESSPLFVIVIFLPSSATVYAVSYTHLREVTEPYQTKNAR